MQVSFNGLELGDGSLYNITAIDGLDSLPDLVIGSTPKPRRTGSWLGGKLAQKRIITIDLEILGDPADDYRTTRPKLALQRACEVTDVETPLNFDLDYGDPAVMVYASITQLHLPTTAGYSRHRTAHLEFTATDPRKYAGVSQTKRTPIAVNPAGASYGQPYGFSYHTTAPISGSFVANNSGNQTTPVTYEINGPVVTPSISLTDAYGTRRTQFNLQLGPADRLVVSTATGQVLLNGQDRYGYTTGATIETLTLSPGDTTVAYGGTTDPSKGSMLSVSWRGASH